jgi:beta-N-acetylhexosaminidase
VRAAGRRLRPLSGAPDVVDLRLRLDHAAGRTAQHVQTAVAERWPGAAPHPALDDEGFAGLLARLAHTDPQARPLVVVTREPLPGTTERDRLEALAAARPDLVVVHTGVPTEAERWFAGLPGGMPAVVLACGTGRANATAAVDLLAGDQGGSA